MNAETRRAFISMDSQKLSDVDKKLFEELMDRGMTQDTLVYSLKELSELLERGYGRKSLSLLMSMMFRWQRQMRMDIMTRWHC